MAVSCAICFLTPLALFLYLRLVKKADIYPFFAGCAVMLLFAFILESGLHNLVFSSPAGPAIRNLRLYPGVGTAQSRILISRRTGNPEQHLAVRALRRLYGRAL